MEQYVLYLQIQSHTIDFAKQLCYTLLQIGGASIDRKNRLRILNPENKQYVGKKVQQPAQSNRAYPFPNVCFNGTVKNTCQKTYF